MSKALDIIMAGVISGLVAYTTSILGVGGTVIGAVLGSMLYQLMTHLFKEPLENVEPQKIKPEITPKIVYIFPLIIIVAVELLYMFSSMYWKSGHIFYILEQATGGNLFRSIGFGLLIMGIYPFIEPKNIKKEYGFILLGVGAIKLLGGFADVNTPITDLYSMIYSELGLFISLLVIGALCYVILSIIEDTMDINGNRATWNGKKIKKFPNKPRNIQNNKKYHNKRNKPRNIQNNKKYHNKRNKPRNIQNNKKYHNKRNKPRNIQNNKKYHNKRNKKPMN